MRIEELKRWHWILLGLIAGLALGHLNVAIEPDTQRRTVERPTFNGLLRMQPRQGVPMIRDIRVYPPQQTGFEVVDRTGKKTRRWISLVTFEKLEPTQDPKVWKYQPWAMHADVTSSGPGQPALVDELRELANDKPWLGPRYAWWEEARWSYIVWTAGAVIVIGGIWPTILNLLVGAGLGRPPRPVEERKWRKSKVKTPKAQPKPAPVLSNDDKRRMEEMEKSLEDFLRPAARPEDPSPAPAGRPAVKPLTAGPLQTAAAPEPQSTDEDKSYAGEFYPTVAHAPKKTE